MKRGLALGLVSVAALVVAASLWWNRARDGRASAAAPAGASAAAWSLDPGLDPGVSGSQPGAYAVADRVVVDGVYADPAGGSGALAPTRTPPPLLRGRVVDELGAPIGGATVWASDRRGVPLDCERAGAGSLPGTVEARTDEQGAFELRGPRPATIRIVARASGFAPHRDDAVRLAAAASVELPPITLQRGAILSGRVVDAAGRGVVGATLAPADAPLAEPLVLSGFRPRRLGTSGEDGRFRLDELACGPWAIEVSSGEHPAALFRGVAEQPGVEVGGLVLELGSGAAIAGRVVGAPDGRWTRLLVECRPAAAPASEDAAPERAAAPRVARVNDLGAFELRGLEPARAYELLAFETADPASAQSSFGRVARSERVPARAGDRDVVVPYARGSGLVFRVLDARTGRPVNEFTVTFGVNVERPLLGHDGKKRDYHLDGEVYLDDLGARSALDRVRFTIHASGYETYRRAEIALPADGRLDLGPILLAPIPVLRVTVLDAGSGAPVGDAHVSLSRQDSGPMAAAERRFDHAIAARWGVEDEYDGASGAAHIVRTDAMGVATLNARRGERCVLRVESPRHAALELADLLFPEDELAVEREVRLTAGGSVVVQALDAGGGIRIGVGIERRAPAERGGVMLPAPAQLGQQHATDADGRVTIEHLEPGIHGFRVQRHAEAPPGLDGSELARIELPGEGNWTEVEVREGQTASVTVREPPAVWLRGCVREGGRPLAGANLSLVPVEEPGGAGDSLFARDPSRPRARTRTGGGGRYALEHLDVGPHVLRVAHADRSMVDERAIELAPGENALDVDLAAAEIRGTIADVSGRPLRGARIAARLAGGDVRRPGTWSYEVFEGPNGVERKLVRVIQDGVVRSGDDGCYVLRGAVAGARLVVVAWGEGHLETVSEAIELGADEVRERVDLRLGIGGDVVVEAAFADGTPARACIVEARSRAGSGGASEIGQIASGSTVLRGLAPGTWSITVMREGPIRAEAEPEQEVEILPGETVRAAFRLP